MTAMQEAFARAEKAIPVSKEQRIWNIVKSKPWITLAEIVQRMGVNRITVSFTVTELVDRGMLDKREQKRPPNSSGRAPHEYRCVQEVFVMLPLPPKEKKPKVPTITEVVMAGKKTLPGVPVFNDPPKTGASLLDQVKAAPFGEVMQIYQYLKDTFK